MITLSGSPSTEYEREFHQERERVVRSLGFFIHSLSGGNGLFCFGVLIVPLLILYLVR